MARKKKEIPTYGTVVLKGVEYYRTRIEDADGRRVALYARTPEELLEKVEEAQRQIEDAVFRRTTPTVAEYCERWLTMQSARIRPTTLIDYTSKVKNYIIEPLGHKYMAEVSSDDIKLAMVNVSSKSCSVVPFPVSWTVKMKKKQKETQDILSYHTQAAGCSDKARAKASGGRQPIEECGRTGL